MKKLILLLSCIATSAFAQTNFWEQTNGPFGGTIGSLAINANGDAFAGAFGGVFRSTDNGDSWQQINNGLTNTLVRTLAINDNSDIFAGTSDGLFRSNDNGDNWVPINTGLTNTRVEAIVSKSSSDIFVGTDGCGREEKRC